MRKPLSGVTARGRLPGFRVAPVPQTAGAISIPAPAEGLDALSPIAAMKETRALTLVNLFPQPGYVEIRGGHARYALVGAAAIESLLPYHGLTSATDALFAATSSVVSNITVAATTTASIALSGMNSARWQHTNFSNTAGNWLHIFNGEDVPRMYDGTTWATCSVTGITPTDIIAGAVFKERLWLVRKSTINPAYLGADAVQGTATPFDLSGVFNEGGFLQAIGTWSVEGGNGPDDRIAFLTSRGEIAIYAGTDPSSNFVIVGVYKVGPPLGRRCMLKVGSDLAIICMDGVVSLKVAMTTDRAAAQQSTLTRTIQPLINQATRLYKDNFGWQLLGYPLGTRAILNVPAIPAGTGALAQEQFIMNAVTGAWCQFKQEYANCWAVWQDRLFYGDNSGRVYEADCQGFDEGSAIDFDVETAFNYCKTRGQKKQFTMCRPLLTSDGAVAPSLAINTDFDRNAIGSPVSFEQSGQAQWDVAVWDVDVWPTERTIIANWVTVPGTGNCASIRMSGSIEAPAGQESGNFVFQINGFDLLFLMGASGP
jgi:hypothetical protein